MTDGDKADLTAVCEFDKSALKKVETVEKTALPTKEDIEAEKAEAST